MSRAGITKPIIDTFSRYISLSYLSYTFDFFFNGKTLGRFLLNVSSSNDSARLINDLSSFLSAFLFFTIFFVLRCSEWEYHYGLWYINDSNHDEDVHSAEEELNKLTATLNELELLPTEVVKNERGENILIKEVKYYWNSVRDF